MSVSVYPKNKQIILDLLLEVAMVVHILTPSQQQKVVLRDSRELEQIWVGLYVPPQKQSTGITWVVYI